ncbi:MAG: hypothetical protein M3159_06835 [Actinomycetota bacterium]|nr:hypothetical protein [Actinomycetota bacterium]
MRLVAGVVAIVAGLVLLIVFAPRQRRAATRLGRYLGRKTIVNAVVLIVLGIVLLFR